MDELKKPSRSLVKHKMASIPGDVLHHAFTEDAMKITDEIADAATSVGKEFSSSSSSMVNLNKMQQPLSGREEYPSTHGGLRWTATIIPDKYIVNGKLIPGLSRRDFDLENDAIKDRRPSVLITQSSFFGSLRKTGGGRAGVSRYFFNGELNAWPAFSRTSLELITLERLRRSGILGFKQSWEDKWKTGNKFGGEREPHENIEKNAIYRARLRTPSWTSKGWAENSPGFVFWFEAQLPKPSLSYGTKMLSTVDNTQCTRLHMFSYRYSGGGETVKDTLTYHSVVILEWDHEKYISVVEADWLNYICGYDLHSDWYNDEKKSDAEGDEEVSLLYRTLPPEMVAPWKPLLGAISFCDLPYRNIHEFKEYVSRYTGENFKFVDPQFTHSYPMKISLRSKSDIARFCINYVTSDPTFIEQKRDCQTFTADFCSFFAGKKNVRPFHFVSRVKSYNRAHLFLYNSRL